MNKRGTIDKSTKSIYAAYKLTWAMVSKQQVWHDTGHEQNHTWP